jgi:uroporphyrinogen-III decarboxylase
MPETGVDWEVSVKKRITRIEVDAKNLNVVLYGEMEPIKSGVITKADFDKIKAVVQKILEA